MALIEKLSYLRQRARQYLRVVEEPLDLRCWFPDVLALQTSSLTLLHSRVLQLLSELRLLDRCKTGQTPFSLVVSRAPLRRPVANAY